MVKPIWVYGIEVAGWAMRNWRTVAVGAVVLGAGWWLHQNDQKLERQAAQIERQRQALEASSLQIVQLKDNLQGYQSALDEWADAAERQAAAIERVERRQRETRDRLADIARIDGTAPAPVLEAEATEAYARLQEEFVNAPEPR